ncbi:MAG TPA: M23 family metallopeptidase [Wenzhouxiangella sp.]|nr:M23 family metallopeptidase [Wenzhouxiangella sp.]
MPERPLTLAVFAAALLLAATAGADTPHITFDGTATQGGLLIAHAPGASSATVDGKAVQLTDDGRFLIAIARDRTDPVKVAVTLPGGQQAEHDVVPEKRQFDIQRIDGLPQDRVTPPEHVLERIRNDNELTRQARKRRDARTDWAAGFSWPLTGRITGVYGSQRILNGEPRNPHWGLDIAAPTGTKVKAPAPGIVTLAHSDMYFSGGTLFIDHGHGLVSAFLHLSALDVEVGDVVERGQTIARVGATGRATGPHLDWRVNLGSIRIDPALLVDWNENPYAEQPR